MAKKTKIDAEADKKADGIQPAELKRVISEINRQKELASEYSGNAGKATQTAVERYGLDRQALSFTRKLAGMEVAKRQSTLRSAIDYFEKMEFFSDIDMFDDLIGIMERIVRTAREKEAGLAAAPTGETNVVRAMFPQ